MNPVRTVGGRLTLALLLVVAGALGIVYLVVVPQLEGRLLDAKRSQFEKDATAISSAAADTVPYAVQGVDWNAFAQTWQQAVGARVAVYEIKSRDPLELHALGDSEFRPADVVDDPVARRAAATAKLTNGVVKRHGVRYLEVAIPPILGAFPQPPFILASTPVESTLETVDVVERRLLIAGLFALLVAVGVGYLGSRMFARRIRRLEQAAERIAAGKFDEPVIDTGGDEIGQLAVAFDNMRQRLGALERARREFVANASHELRTPLFALGGLLELLVDEDLDEDTRREFLVTAREQVERLTKLATDLLDLSRLDAGRLHVEREQVELEDVARDLADEFRGVAQTKEHPLHVVGEDASAVADEERVFQIGRILVENALVHTPAGTPVRVRTTTANGEALLAVEDEGPGIPPEHAAHVFERFYRVNGAVTSGSGLGLAIARELAELMGGRIELESSPGHTAFTLRLPTETSRARRELSRVG
ncbi:MAG: HAMP domain-containing histidine kinase [Actinomycetota bacterium]|nr:HAMP domain-containing histidine kinase [Actinomycetota bacterium]